MDVFSNVISLRLVREVGWSSHYSTAKKSFMLKISKLPAFVSGARDQPQPWLPNRRTMVELGDSTFPSCKECWPCTSTREQTKK